MPLISQVLSASARALERVGDAILLQSRPDKGHDPVGLWRVSRFVTRKERVELYVDLQGTMFIGISLVRVLSDCNKPASRGVMQREKY